MDILLWVAGVLVLVQSGVLAYVINRQNKLEGEMAKFRQDVNNSVLELKTNYLDRFSDLKQHFTDKMDEIKRNDHKEFLEIKTLLARLSTKLDNNDRRQ